MIKPFSQPGRLGASLERYFDLVILSILILAAIQWVKRDLPVNGILLALYAGALLIAVLVLRTWLGSRRRSDEGGDSDRSRTQLGLLLYGGVPLAYIFSAALPLEESNRQLLEFSALTVAFTLLATRALALPPAMGAVNHRILVLGTGDKAAAVEKTLRESAPGVQIAGFYPGPLEPAPQVAPQSVLSPSRPLSAMAVEMGVDSVVVAVTERRGGSMPLQELLDCRLSGVQVLDLSTYFERCLGQVRLDALYAGWLVFGQGFRQGLGRRVVKRLFDVFFASLLLTLALPVMGLAAALIVLESGFPILYRQERVGRNGRLFHVIKFRSMRTDAEKDGRPRWAMAGDDRITRVGRILRKLRIDELPQLISVLKGDMSLVGPRPERPFFVDKLVREVPFYGVRHSVKPGLTGWAQVRYHYGATVEDSAEKLQYDLYYVKNHSLLLDLLILIETVGVVLTGKGAN